VRTAQRLQRRRHQGLVSFLDDQAMAIFSLPSAEIVVAVPGGHWTEIKHFRQVETGSQISLN